MEVTKRNLNSNNLLLRYHFSDNSHSFDAYTHNQCERELLAIVKTISDELKVQTKVEIEAKEEGSLIDIYNFFVSNEGIALAQWGLLFVAIIQLFINRKTKKDKLEQNLNIEYLKSQINKAKEEAEQKKISNQNISEDIVRYLLNENIKLKKQKSNLYKRLQSYPKVDKIEARIIYDNKENAVVVNRNEFDDFIIADEIEPIIDESAQIEIISPVLKRSKYKWKGLYVAIGQPIDFTMKDAEFKESIINDGIPFQTGTFIDCELSIERRIDEDGNIYNANYKVVSVDKIYIGNSIIETSKGRKKRKKKEAGDKQLELFPDDEIS